MPNNFSFTVQHNAWLELGSLFNITYITGCVNCYILFGWVFAKKNAWCFNTKLCRPIHIKIQPYLSKCSCSVPSKEKASRNLSSSTTCACAHCRILLLWSKIMKILVPTLDLDQKKFLLTVYSKAQWIQWRMWKRGSWFIEKQGASLIQLAIDPLAILSTNSYTGVRMRACSLVIRYDGVDVYLAIGIWVLNSQTQLGRTNCTNHRTSGSLLGLSHAVAEQLLVVCTTTGWRRLTMNGGSSGNYIPPMPTKEKLSAPHMYGYKSYSYTGQRMAWYMGYLHGKIQFSESVRGGRTSLIVSHALDLLACHPHPRPIAIISHTVRFIIE